MLGQGTITIDNITWQVSIAANPADLMAGLGGVSGIPADTGELFDLGTMQTLNVTTEPMLFNLDIAMMDDSLKVTEIYRDVAPGYDITSQHPAQYFLEVNSGELADVNVGDQAALIVTQMPVTATATTSWLDILQTLMPLLTSISLMAFMYFMVRQLFPQNARSQKLLADTRKRSDGKFFIDIDRLGDIIITHSERPNQSVFLQLQSDKEPVLDLLQTRERRDLESGWPVEVRDSEPRASTLDEVWELAAARNPELLPATIPEDKRAEIEKKYGKWAVNLAMAVCPYNDVQCVEREAARFYAIRSFRDRQGSFQPDARPQTIPGSRVWLRVGDQADRVYFGSPYAAGRLIGRVLSRYGNPNYSCHYVNLGVEIPPHFEHRNYISLFRGDAEARPERGLTEPEKQEFERGIQETLRGYSPASSTHPIDKGQEERSRQDGAELDFLPDDPEFLAYTIEDIGYREKIDNAFLQAIQRARGS